MDDIIKKMKSIVQSGQKRDMLVLSLALISLFTFCSMICSLVVSRTANAGFNIVFTSLLNIGYIVGAHYIVTKSKTPIAIGFLIGVTATMSALNFMTSIYWGQLSNCTDLSGGDIRGYTCNNRSAYGAVSAFSVLIFLNQIVICVAVILWKNDLIGDETDGYDDRLDHSSTRQNQIGGAHDHLMESGSSAPVVHQTSADI